MFGVLGCILAFVVFTILCYRKMSTLYITIIAAVVVMIFNNMNFVETLLEVYMKRAGGYIESYFLMYLWGAILGRLYSVSGAAVSIAEVLAKTFFRPDDSPQRRQILAILVIILAGGILAYGGINLIVLIFTLYPLMLSIFEAADIPKRFVAGVCMAGIASFVVSAPGTPQLANIVAMQFLGTSSMAGLVAGIISCIVEIIVSVYLLNKLITHAKNKGESFAYGEKDIRFEAGQAKPHWFLGLLPLIVMWILFNFFNWNIAIAQIVAILISIVAFYPFLKKHGVIPTLNEGGATACTAILGVAMVIGFGEVVRQSAGFSVIVDSLIAMNASPYIKLPVVVAIAAAFAGAASAGVVLVLPALGPIFLNMGIPAAAIHRISTFACTTLDTVPTNPSMLMVLEYTGTDLKGGYSAAFISTIVATTLGTIVCTVIMAVFPNLP